MAKKNGVGELDYHVVAVRMRVVGSGNLKLQLMDYDDIQVNDLVAIPMHVSTRFEPTRLANFQSQRVRLHGYITELDEYFDIHRIIIYGKPVAMEYPGGGLG